MTTEQKATVGNKKQHILTPGTHLVKVLDAYYVMYKSGTEGFVFDFKDKFGKEIQLRIFAKKATFDAKGVRQDKEVVNMDSLGFVVNLVKAGTGNYKASIDTILPALAPATRSKTNGEVLQVKVIQQIIGREVYIGTFTEVKTMDKSKVMDNTIIKTQAVDISNVFSPTTKLTALEVASNIKDTVSFEAFTEEMKQKVQAHPEFKKHVHVKTEVAMLNSGVDADKVVGTVVENPDFNGTDTPATVIQEASASELDDETY